MQEAYLPIPRTDGPVVAMTGSAIKNARDRSLALLLPMALSLRQMHRHNHVNETVVPNDTQHAGAGG